MTRQLYSASALAAFILGTTCSFDSVNAFVTTTSSPTTRQQQQSAATTTLSTAGGMEEVTIQSLKEDLDEPTFPKNNRPVFSQAIPFLEVNPVLLSKENDFAGNFGFDPLRLASNKETLWTYREAEVKHARLAMLAAVGWPISELLDRPIAQYFGVPSVLDDGDRVPSILNGGLEKISPAWWGFCLGLTASIDLYGVRKARAASTTTTKNIDLLSQQQRYTPGNLGFDPLGLYPIDEEGRKEMQLKEIKHGRVAMMAVLGYACQEYASQVGVVNETPIFFQPITETIEGTLQEMLITATTTTS